MISDVLKKDIQQVRLNELSGKHAHQRLLRLPIWGVRVVDVLTFTVPILYFAPKLIWTDAHAKEIINAIDVVLSVIRNPPYEQRSCSPLMPQRISGGHPRVARGGRGGRDVVG